MRRTAAALSLLVISAFATSCGGSSSGASSGESPTAPASTAGGWTFTGRIVETLSGIPVPDATVSAGSMTATTHVDGRFELSRSSAPALPLNVSITAPGHLTRVTQLRTSGSDIDVIATGGGFDLTFYRQIARDAYDHSGKLDVIRAWPNAPRYYIRTVYVDDASESVDRGVLTLAQVELPEATRVLSGGRFVDAEVETGTAERTRVDGVVLINFYKNDLPTGPNYCGYAYVGPPSSEAGFAVGKMGCSCSTRKVAAATLWHEVGHVLGLRHTPQGGNHLMAPMLEDRCCTTPYLSPLETVHMPLVNHRPLGNMDVDDDPTSFSFIRPDVATQPMVACGRSER